MTKGARREFWRWSIQGGLLGGAISHWANCSVRADNFMEGDPHIVTAYCLLALASAWPER
jgi:hypothetical protein